MRFKKTISTFMAIAGLMTSCLQPSAEKEIEVTAPAALLMDAGTGKVLYEKNPHEIRVCASITKVMTLLLVMEAVDSGKIKMNDMVTASAHAASMGGSDIWLEPGETMTVDEMIKATTVASANDAAVALAEHISGSEEVFVDEMNRKTQKLGMKDTVFKNCNGLDEDGHVTSAYDVAIMSRELMKHKTIFNYTSIWIDYLRNGKTQLVNTNKLLKGYKGITGLKTGTTSKAGSCISATAERDGLNLIAVVLGSATGKDRFRDAAKILNHGFANYVMMKPEVKKQDMLPVNVVNGMQNTVNTGADLTTGFLIEKGKENEVKSDIVINEEVEAPVIKGQVVGKITYSLGDEILAEYDITALNDIDKLSFSSVFGILFRQFVAH